jgi:FeS assembly SUF system protein
METNQQPDLKEQIVGVLRTCYDPEIPVNIYELGLIYDVHVDEERNAYVKMTLTSPACPVAGTLPGEVEDKIRRLPGIKDVRVDLVWEPPWNPDMMSDVARYELGMM